MMNKLLYLGFDKETIAKVRADMDEDNIKTVRNVSFLLILILAILVIFYLLFDNDIKRNVICIVSAMLLLAVCYKSNGLLKQKELITPALADLLIDSLTVLCFAVGIYLGTFAAKGAMAVAPIWMFFFATLIFNRLPFRNLIVIMLAGVCFCLCSYVTKEGYVFRYDVMHGMTSIIASVYMAWPKSRMKVQNILALKTLQEANVEILETVEVQEKEADFLRQLAMHDGLTGLYNKEAFEEMVTGFLSNQIAGKAVHAMICLDIDDFKAVNDSQGHLVGDDVLRGVGSIIESMFRKDDIAGRFGGDEFVIFVKDTGDSKKVAEKIKCLLRLVREKSCVSMSAGIAFYPESGVDYGQLFAHADEALYRAKKQGKNMCTVYR